MSGWLYLIKNGDLCKIGITKNFKNRMRQLKPDSIIAKLYSSKFMQLERELHKKYKNVRIPQTEYFRLDHKQIMDIKKIINEFYYPKRIILYIYLNTLSLTFMLLVLVILFRSLTINEMNNLLLSSFLLMEKILFFLSFLSLFIKSGKYLSFFNELKFRGSKLIFFSLFAFFFRFSSMVIFL